MAKIATQIMLGKRLGDFNLKKPRFTHFGVKEAVLPFNMFPDVDPVLALKCAQQVRFSDLRTHSKWFSLSLRKPKA